MREAPNEIESEILGELVAGQPEQLRLKINHKPRKRKCNYPNRKWKCAWSNPPIESSPFTCHAAIAQALQGHLAKVGGPPDIPDPPDSL